MSDYRNLIRFSEDGFDGTTIEATGIYTQSKNVWTTTIATEVGVFSPLALGRKDTCSIARIQFEGEVDPDVDSIEILDSVGAVRFSRPASIVSSGFFFLYPQDSIRVTAAGATKADLIIEDLNEERLRSWIETEITAQIAPPQAYSERTIGGASQLLPWTGRLTVFLEFEAAGDIQLPALADVALGDTVRFIRNTGAAPVTITTSTTTDRVNGVHTTGIDNVGGSSYTLRSLYESIEYTRVTEGWQHHAGQGSHVLVSTSADPAYLTAGTREGTVFVFDHGTVAGSVLRLPAAAGVAVGVGYTIRNFDSYYHGVVPEGGETINGDAVFYIPPGGVLHVELADQLTGSWLATSLMAPTSTQVITTLPASIALNVGTRIIQVQVAGTLTLPLLSSVPLETEFIVQLSSLSGSPVRIITQNALDAVNGLQGLVATQTFLQRLGDAVSYKRTVYGWQKTVLVTSDPYEITQSSDIDLVPFSGTQYVESTGGAGQVVRLPDLTKIAVGTQVFHNNSSGNAHTLRGFGAQNIYGANTLAIPPGTGFVAYYNGVQWAGWATP